MQSVELVGRLLVSLAAVLAVIWLIARKLRRGGRTKESGLMEVIGRQQLSRAASVAIVRVGEQALVIGITETQVSVLGETDLATVRALTGSTVTDSPARTPQEPRPARAAGPVRTARAARVPRRTRATGHARSAKSVAAAASTSSAAITETADRRTGPLAGSALSPQTWRQTVESLRDLTSR